MRLEGPVLFHWLRQSVHSGHGQQCISHFHQGLSPSIHFGNRLQSVFWIWNWTSPCGHISSTSVFRTSVACSMMWSSTPISDLIPIWLRIQQMPTLFHSYQHTQMRSSSACESALECWAVPDMKCCSTWWCHQCRWCQQSILRWRLRTCRLNCLCPFPDMMSICQMEGRHTNPVDLCQSSSHTLIGTCIRIPMRRCQGQDIVSSDGKYPHPVHQLWHRVWSCAIHTIRDWLLLSDTFRRSLHSFQQVLWSVSVRNSGLL